MMVADPPARRQRFQAPHLTRPREREPRCAEWLLRWAFRDQRVSLEGGRLNPGPSRSATANVCEILALQAIVQGGGGQSTPEPEDAILIASHVQRLEWHPRARLVYHSRRGNRPNPMIGARQKYQPAEWRINRWGKFAKVEKAGALEFDAEGKPVRDVHGKPIRAAVCPLVLDPSWQDIRRARLAYAEWWRALRDVSLTLRVEQPLTKWECSTSLPPAKPWRGK